MDNAVTNKVLNPLLPLGAALIDGRRPCAGRGSQLVGMEEPFGGSNGADQCYFSLAMANWMNYADAMVSLIMPRCCPGCDRPLNSTEKHLCTFCIGDLPYTHAMSDARNPVARLFWGRVELGAAAALLRFQSGGRVQHMLHRLKYKGDRRIGIGLGRMMGEAAKDSPLFAGIDHVMAVPLHRRKERIRGYNQAQLLVNGLCEVWPLQPAGGSLLRVVHTATQTQRGRLERWRNVRTAFEVEDNTVPTGAHVLLIDDVVTTGATLESCAQALLALPGLRVSVLTAAHA